MSNNLASRPHHVEPLAVIDGELLDECGICESNGSSHCPGGLAPLQTDPYDEDVNNTHRLAYLHDVCATERAMDI